MADTGLDLQALANSFVTEETSQESVLSQLTLLASKNELKLEELVTALGEHLTNVNHGPRSKATLLLSRVLERATSMKIPKASLKYLVEFYCDRLQDIPCVTQIVQGMVALLQHHPLDDEDVSGVIRSVFAELQVQSLAQTTRKKIFEIFQLVVYKYRTALEGMGADFIFGFIQCVEGEKDPRNLVVMFRLCKVLLSEIPDATRFLEEFFAVVSCYFPITFTPSPNDPSGISKDDLVLGLRSCLTATQGMSTFVIPFLLEKLDSTIPNTRIDALATLSVCVSKYDLTTLLKYATEIWSCVRQILFAPAIDKLVQGAAFELVTALSRALGSSVMRHNLLPSDEADVKQKPTPATAVLSAMIKPVLNQYQDTLGQLLKPDGGGDVGLLEQYGSILQHMAGGCVSGAETIFGAVGPKLCEVWMEGSDVHFEGKVVVLSQLVELVRSVVVATNAAQNEEWCAVVADRKDELLPMLQSILLQPSVVNHDLRSQVRLLSLSGQQILASATTPVLANDELEEMMKLWTAILMKETDGNLRSAAVKALRAVGESGSSRGDLVARVVMPKLFDELSRNGKNASIGKQISELSVGGALAAVTLLSAIPAILRTTLPMLVQLGREYFTPTSLDREGSPAEFLRLILKALCDVVSSSKPKSMQELPMLMGCGTSILDLVTQGAVEAAGEDGVEDVTVSLAGHFLSSVMKALRPKDQLDMLRKCLDVFMDGKHDGFARMSHHSAVNQQKMSMILFNVVAAIPRSIIDFEGCLPYVDRWIKMASDPKGQNPLRDNMAKMAASVLNKFPLGEKLDEVVTQYFDVLENSVAEGSMPALETYTWLARGMVLRCHPSGSRSSSFLVDLIAKSDGQVGHVVASNIGQLMAGTDFLSREWFANVNMMHKQKFFSETIERLTGAANAKLSEVQLVAVTSLLSQVSLNLLITDADNILPLLYQSLKSQDPASSFKLVSLNTLQSLIEKAPTVFETRLDSWIPLLLAELANPSSMKAREAALKALGEIPKLNFRKIYPFKELVIAKVLPCLDDPKRLVRQAAVTCRSAWYLAGHDEN